MITWFWPALLQEIRGMETKKNKKDCQSFHATFMLAICPCNMCTIYKELNLSWRSLQTYLITEIKITASICSTLEHLYRDILKSSNYNVSTTEKYAHQSDTHGIQIKTGHCQDHKEHQYNDMFHTAPNALIDEVGSSTQSNDRCHSMNAITS